MLTAAIASGDTTSSAQLLASLQQTGLVSSVKQWAIRADKPPDASEAIPDVVLLDLGRDAEIYFAFGTYVRRLRPNVRLIACSALFPPNQQLLLDAMRCGVQDVIPKPVSPGELQAILRRLQESQPTHRATDKLIAVMGAKGGVGTTTVAVNLAVQLSLFAHKRTLLLDFARPLGNAHLLLDVQPRFGIRDAIENLERLDSHFLSGLLTHHQTKLELLGGALHPEEWQSIPITPLERVVNVAQSGFEMVVMDIGAQFSSDLSPMLQTARMILLATEAEVPSLWALERRLQALVGFGIPPERVRIIVNRWHKGDEEILKSMEKDMKCSVLAYLPNDFRKVNTSINLGLPLGENHDNSLTRRYQALASQLTGGNGVAPRPAAKRSGLGGFFSVPTKR
jgi:pilus assembly protein CpaE